MSFGSAQLDFAAAAILVPAMDAEGFLKQCQATYDRNELGYFVVRGNLVLANKHLYTIPDLSEVVVKGEVDFSGNRLRDLKHVPQSFSKLSSDFGVFTKFQDIPLHLRSRPVRHPLEMEIHYPKGFHL